jgi:hypothetical protein
MLRRVALVRTDVSEENYRLYHQGDKNWRAGDNVNSNEQTEARGAPSDLTRATRRNIPEDAILHRHSREHLKSYIALTG